MAQSIPNCRGRSRSDFWARQGRPMKDLESFRPLGDLDRLISGDVSKALGRFTCRPGKRLIGRRPCRRVGQSFRPGYFRRNCHYYPRSGKSSARPRPGPATSTRILAPIAERFDLVPTSLTLSQCRPCPGFRNRALYALSPVIRRRSRRTGRGRRRCRSRRTKRRALSEGGPSL